MKIKVNETTQKEVEINLPFYCKCPPFYYKVISGESALQVHNGTERFGIATVFIETALCHPYETIHDSEFYEAYNKVRSVLHGMAI